MTINTLTPFNYVNIGTVANDGTGDDLRTAFNKINANFGFMSNLGFNAGNINALGHTVEAAAFIGDGSQLTNITSSYGNINVATYLPIYSGNIGNVTVGNLTVTGILTSNPIANIFSTYQLGYVTGAGGTVTQLSNKSTAVILNKASGNIIMNNAALTNGANVGFRFQNSTIASTDILILNIANGATAGAYHIFVENVTTGNANIRLYNVYGSSLSETITINFAVIKAATS